MENNWVAAVQLRQNVSHWRTLFYLEQLILKHDAAAHCIRITQMANGIDFFFADKTHAVKFVKFIAKVTPMRCRHDQQLVSNPDNFKFTFSVEISPVCREDLICLPPSLGNIGPLVICTQVTNTIALLEPHTLRHCFWDSRQYWSSSFKSLLSSRQLVDYLILDVKRVSCEVDIRGSKYALYDACVTRVSDFGKKYRIFNTRTHLGHLLSRGDHALGYEVHGTNNCIELKNCLFPEVVLIKKSYEEKRQKKSGKPRSWKLKSLEMEVDDSAKGKDDEERSAEYEQFLRDLEENREMRTNVSLYRNKEYQPSEIAEGDDVPYIALEELLDD
ncbi:hypothetical protein LIER_37171 [Lithospermum erythrorhizon]|uniref:60S ribosomal export protein NMD3 n=1 Tax=Lithospermum erythrorhizon TaxID=34254 RepID=A0AAV3PGD0_LITER